MGRYHIVLNLDRCEYLHPHVLGDGLKLPEIIYGAGALRALGVLLGRNGETRHFEAPLASVLLGRWAGQRIAIVGDYSGDGLYQTAIDGKDGWVDISLCLRELLLVSGFPVGEPWDSSTDPAPIYVADDDRFVRVARS